MPQRKQAAQPDTGEVKTPLSQRPKIVTVLRVKDEAQYIEYALRSLEPLGGEIVLLDDGSTDATPDIVRSFGDVHYHRQDDLPMDEGRDRTALYRWALELDPEWIFCLDGDEVLDPVGAQQVVLATEQAPETANTFKLNLAVMATPITARIQHRFIGHVPGAVWSQIRCVRARDMVRDYEYSSTFEHNLHCGFIPDIVPGVKWHPIRLNAWIRYYGYESPGAVEKKRAFYVKNSPQQLPRFERIQRARARLGTRKWKDGPDCRAMGITGTVTYKGG